MENSAPTQGSVPPSAKGSNKVPGSVLPLQKVPQKGQVPAPSSGKHVKKGLVFVASSKSQGPVSSSANKLQGSVPPSKKQTNKGQGTGPSPFKGSNKVQAFVPPANKATKKLQGSVPLPKAEPRKNQNLVPPATKRGKKIQDSGAQPSNGHVPQFSKGTKKVQGSVPLGPNNDKIMKNKYIKGKDLPDKKSRQLPVLRPLPPMKFEYLDLIQKMVIFERNNWKLGDERENKQSQFLASLQQILMENGFENAKLCPYGSSINGLGLIDSDLDICMTHGEIKKMPKRMDQLRTIKNISKLLKKQRNYQFVQPIDAKIPIVKLYNSKFRLEADLSLYNFLPLLNTQLLRTYVHFDERVRDLGIYVKVFAKSCFIGDASLGGLSSYSYNILVIHFLQRTQPPILPVLQEIDIPSGNNTTEFIVNECNTYFCHDLKRLKEYMQQNYEGYPNKMSLGALVVEFFRYYTEIFDFNNDIVQIRQSAIMSKSDKKLWRKKPIAIQDPFDLNHNLSKNLSPSMYIYIRNTFIRARNVYCDSSITKLLQDVGILSMPVKFISEFYFTKLLPLEE